MLTSPSAAELVHAIVVAHRNGEHREEEGKRPASASAIAAAAESKSSSTAAQAAAHGHSEAELREARNNLATALSGTPQLPSPLSALAPSSPGLPWLTPSPPPFHLSPSSPRAVYYLERGVYMGARARIGDPVRYPALGAPQAQAAGAGAGQTEGAKGAGAA